MTSEKPMQKKKAAHGRLVLVLLLVALAFILQSCSSGKDQAPTPPSETDIFVHSQFAVEDYLKSPSTAQYPSSKDVYITKISDHEYKVASYVDSQNSLGATVRSKYVVDLIYNDDWSQYETSSVIIDAQKYK